MCIERSYCFKFSFVYFNFCLEYRQFKTCKGVKCVKKIINTFYNVMYQ